MDFEVIVIGSGFGGAITSCRLAQKGKKVLVLERGHKWDRTTYPRNLEDQWIWSHSHPERYHGWADLRRFKGMAVIAGAGVGGGSLIYANVSAVPPESVFNSGWPPEISFAGLQPYYSEVASVLDIRQLPKNQWSPRVQLMRDAATQLGQADRFRAADIAVSFDENFQYDFSVEPNIANSRRFVNKHGVEQGDLRALGRMRYRLPCRRQEHTRQKLLAHRGTKRCRDQPAALGYPDRAPVRRLPGESQGTEGRPSILGIEHGGVRGRGSLADHRCAGRADRGVHGVRADVERGSVTSSFVGPPMRRSVSRNSLTRLQACIRISL